VVELESLYHGPVDSDAVVTADSLANRACFADEYGSTSVWFGTIRLGLLRSSDEVCDCVAGCCVCDRWSDVKVASFEFLSNLLALNIW
jgi:hypothetical protein